jgi:hypothetical protein
MIRGGSDDMLFAAISYREQRETIDYGWLTQRFKITEQVKL